MLIINQKSNHVTTSKDILGLFNRKEIDLVLTPFHDLGQKDQNSPKHTRELAAVEIINNNNNNINGKFKAPIQKN